MAGTVSIFKKIKYPIHFHFSSSNGKKGSRSNMKSCLINGIYISSLSTPTEEMVSVAVEPGRGALTESEAQHFVRRENKESLGWLRVRTTRFLNWTEIVLTSLNPKQPLHFFTPFYFLRKEDLDYKQYNNDKTCPEWKILSWVLNSSESPSQFLQN